ncbi:cysteine desulfurase CsdA [Vibrio tubiashii]|uniref:cysteine desulfurase CsdA n=1 Tax=Vibrio tubiashii TaxID=29498 RepID=UPI001EFE8C49|nr:cysteine desulfurase CsdA [Vibrio tubiashii]MCG9581637.1 cysteine desulfurase CsdA [Vibrio tubiashii]MCG9615228.1 cysteine desulfurase CsdA [Vibrio tubiashii]MCG9688599.1 cysteine desulfurase CsdA [Vibrio tubiashii]
MFDAKLIADQFPALKQQINDQRLVYLDSAATSQKPNCVIKAISDYYSQQNANVHRGSHSLTAKATSEFESARETVANFVGAASASEIIWTRGATEALNLIAQTYARSILTPDDEILVSEMEHHANIVPWQIVAEQTGAKVVKVPMTHESQFDFAAFQQLISDKTKIVALAHITNVTGTRQPIEQVIELAHQHDAIVVVDGAQGVVHEKVDVQAISADFYVFSGHKLFAPAGIGVLYGKLSLLESMPPWHGGGKMVEKVSFSGTTFTGVPGKFEAGTPNVAGAIALATAINWYSALDQVQVEQHIHQLVEQAHQILSQIEDVQILGFQQGASVISFVIDGVHHQDVATLLDQQGIAVRAGNHCAHPLMDALGVKGTIRASFAVYNTMEDVDRLVAAVEKAVDML